MNSTSNVGGFEHGGASEADGEEITHNMTQDFSRKMVIVLRDDLASWQLANTIGHIAAYLGNKMSEPFDTGNYFVSRDNLNYPRNSQFPIITLKTSQDDLLNLVEKLHQSGLLWIGYVQEMIDMIDDEELARSLSNKTSQEMDMLGVGIFGSKEELKQFTDGLKLWK